MSEQLAPAFEAGAGGLELDVKPGVEMATEAATSAKVGTPIFIAASSAAVI